MHSIDIAGQLQVRSADPRSLKKKKGLSAVSQSSPLAPVYLFRTGCPNPHARRTPPSFGPQCGQSDRCNLYQSPFGQSHLGALSLTQNLQDSKVRRDRVSSRGNKDRLPATLSISARSGSGLRSLIAIECRFKPPSSRSIDTESVTPNLEGPANELWNTVVELVAGWDSKRYIFWSRSLSSSRVMLL